MYAIYHLIATFYKNKIISLNFWENYNMLISVEKTSNYIQMGQYA